jgi:hypothetical protein
MRHTPGSGKIDLDVVGAQATLIAPTPRSMYGWAFWSNPVYPSSLLQPIFPKLDCFQALEIKGYVLGPIDEHNIESQT